MMNIEDNTFDFKVRDRLQKECRERSWKLRRFPEDNRIMIDMITYCSQGNEEEAALNLQTSMDFKDGFKRTCRSFGMWVGEIGWASAMAEQFLFLFWKKSFIELKVAVHKDENLPRESWHEVLMREHGRFLIDQNFTDSFAFEAEVLLVIDVVLQAIENLNNTFKELMKYGEHN